MRRFTLFLIVLGAATAVFALFALFTPTAQADEVGGCGGGKQERQGCDQAADRRRGRSRGHEPHYALSGLDINVIDPNAQFPCVSGTRLDRGRSEGAVYVDPKLGHVIGT